MPDLYHLYNPESVSQAVQKRKGRNLFYPQMTQIHADENPE
jgi:hypothetical protein